MKGNTMSRGAKTLYFFERRKSCKNERIDWNSHFSLEKIPVTYMNRKNSESRFWRYFCFHQFFLFWSIFQPLPHCFIPDSTYSSPLSCILIRENNYLLNLPLLACKSIDLDINMQKLNCWKKSFQLSLCVFF